MDKKRKIIISTIIAIVIILIISYIWLLPAYIIEYGTVYEWHGGSYCPSYDTICSCQGQTATPPRHGEGGGINSYCLGTVSDCKCYVDLCIKGEERQIPCSEVGNFGDLFLCTVKSCASDADCLEGMCENLNASCSEGRCASSFS